MLNHTPPSVLPLAPSRPPLDDQIRTLIPQIIPQLVEAAMAAGTSQPSFTLDFKLEGQWAMPVPLGGHAAMLELFSFLQKSVGSEQLSALLTQVSDKKYCRIGHPEKAHWVVTCTGTPYTTHLSLRYTRPGQPPAQ
ncbi:MAG TPA: hypothetical protein VHP58_06270 [Alphaproteobacteria bacterium]|nr:hypothetical protein [Alphaproteobacteria bacterium]